MYICVYVFLKTGLKNAEKQEFFILFFGKGRMMQGHPLVPQSGAHGVPKIGLQTIGNVEDANRTASRSPIRRASIDIGDAGQSDRR